MKLWKVRLIKEVVWITNSESTLNIEPFPCKQLKNNNGTWPERDSTRLFCYELSNNFRWGQEWSPWNYIKHEQMFIEWRRKSRSSSSIKTDSTMKPLDHPSFIGNKTLRVILYCRSLRSLVSSEWSWPKRPQIFVSINQYPELVEREREISTGTRMPQLWQGRWTVIPVTQRIRSSFLQRGCLMTMVQLCHRSDWALHNALGGKLIRPCHVTTTWSGNRLGL